MEYKNQVYKNGIKRFTLETDLVELVKSLRMLKILSKIILSQNQKWLLGLEDSNLLTNHFCNSQEEYEINAVQSISSTYYESIFGQRKSIIGPNLVADLITSPLDHNHLPSYLSKDIDLEFKMKVDNLISNFAEEKVTAQNMKILKLAYGFIEEDKMEKEDEGFREFILKTEDSNNAMLEPNNRVVKRFN